MKLGGVRASTNVEDRRGQSGARTKGLAISGGTIVLALVISVVTGKNPLEVISSLSGGQATPGAGTSASTPVDPNDPEAMFAKQVLATTEDTWKIAMPKLGGSYREPVLVLFRNGVQSACGMQESAVGPFYCPGDSKVYIDLDFLDDLQKKLNMQGDFAKGYVIAHEVGHHVQNLLGTSRKARATIGKDEGADGASVRLELQADCYAGVWGAYAKSKGLLEVGDVEEGLNAATAIGDDTLQRRAQGRVTPETFSHGSSEQRSRWFKRGLEAGDPNQCETLQTTQL